MKKKNLKQIREAQKAKRLKEANERIQIKEKEKVLKAKDENKKKAVAATQTRTAAQKKSRVKAAGVKSTFFVNDSIVMTSFGRGNDAVIEKRIKNNVVEDINNPPNFDIVSIERDGKIINIKSKRLSDAQAEKPPIGMDAIRRKSVLEKKYFGMEFLDDNIHIQLIYNILDIEKILALYSNNIVFALDNMIGDAEFEGGEFIGNLNTKILYKDFGVVSEDDKEKADCGDEKAAINNAIREAKKADLDNYVKNPRLAYFGNAFYSENKKKDKDKDYAKRVYDIIALMGNLRQVCFHGKNDTWLYSLENLNAEFKEVLDDAYERAISPLNKNFIKQNKVNLIIIKNTMTHIGMDIEPKKLAKDYYNFIVSKDYKNIGFSIKRLREEAFSQLDAAYIHEDRFNSVRHKLYKITDFMIYSYYVNKGNGTIEENIAQLRAMLTKEEKDSFYLRESKKIWENVLKDTVEYVRTLLTKDSLKKLEKEPLHEDMELLPNDMISTDTNYFCKLIYLATMFLDGKEINDMLTTLINKFDNIRSYIETINKLNLNTTFTNKYKFFENSKDICQDLKNINSFARMQKPDVNAKKAMYKDALYVLGVAPEISEEELDEIVDKILGYTSDGKKDKKASTGFRNFIASNVINSDRFKYLVRYSNAKKIKAVAANMNVVRFAFKQLPDSQITRCYNSCKGGEALDRKTQEKYLLSLFEKIDFKMFEDVKQNTNEKGTTREEIEHKDKMRAVISLYLTILYLITKKLVNVNSRYVIALHCLERDMKLYRIKYKKRYCISEENCFDLTKQFINEGYFKKRVSDYLNININNSNGSTFKIYRDNIAHLSVIRNLNAYIGDIDKFDSYFQLYHYIMQRIIDDTLNKNYEENLEKEPNSNINIYSNETIEGYLKSAKEHHTYCKDFVKAMNAPFGYNLPRFKNLSIDALFDKNDTRDKSQCDN